MKLRTHRLRRVAASLALGVGGVAGVIGLTAGTAGAATTATVSATSKTIARVGTTQVAGTVTITLPTGALTTPNTLHIAVATTPAGGIVDFSKTPTVTSTGVLETHTAAAGHATFTIVLTAKTPATSATITISGVKYTTDDTSATAKDVKVTPTDATYTFSPASAVNATFPSTGPTTPTRVLLANDTTRPIPPVGIGATGGTAGSWTLSILPTTVTSVATGQGVGKGSYVTITVAPHTGTQSCATTNAVAFDGSPTVSVTTATTRDVSGTPTFTVTMKSTAACSTKFAPSILRITFTSAVKFTSSTGAIVLSISGVKYSTAYHTTAGTVTVSDSYFRYTGATGATVVTGTASDAATGITSTNAIVSAAYLSSTTSTTPVAANAFDHSVGAVSLVESVPPATAAISGGTQPTAGDYVCISVGDALTTVTRPATGSHTPSSTVTDDIVFNTTSTPTVKVTGSATTSTVGYATTGMTAQTVRFKVTTTGTAASTFTVSGLAVNLSTTASAPVPVYTAFYSTSPKCTSTVGSPTDNVAVIFPVSAVPLQIYGATADTTAAAELETAFHPVGTGCPINTHLPFTKTLGSRERPVILARDTAYPDALASQYLAGYLGTGTLLTPRASLSQVTANALRIEGISHVYIVGGPLAISTTVMKRIESLPVYSCGGQSEVTSTGAPVLMKVTRITGKTAYTTAEAIATAAPKTHIDSVDLAGAYTTTNKTGGNGMYNDTAGLATSAPKSSGLLKTAILATGQGFQDALSASVLSYDEGIPTLLTTPTALATGARTGLETLNIKQVIVMGGPDAVSNTVVKAVQAMGISVLRVAGVTFQDTAVQTAHLETTPGTTHAGLGWDTDGTILVSRGTWFTDGLAGAVLVFRTPGAGGEHPLLLTKSPSTVGTPLATYLKAHGTATPPVSRLVVLGGPDAVTPQIIASMQTDLKS